ncbi:tetratricopeptide repeat protein [Sulfuriferula thiophila]|uniref:tetratricopeptide repeat protein n=1 Tax=Sulfuriferula thiophila TaxID=1781211 RepID=UPI001678AB56|nr:tetratricopeptide repeat protein [Sulfuriferula thiophila]
MAITFATADHRPINAKGMVVKRATLLIMMTVWTSSAYAEITWESLWRTADQRGEQLMQQGKAATAASTYNDPRRKAYAELQAGNFPHAARDLAAFNDSVSNYNRGNALAHAGQLQDAIKAYDAVLRDDPKNKDARHNRNLVAQALKKQQSQPKPGADKKDSSSDNKKGNDGQTSTQQNQSDTDKNQSSQNSKNQDQQNKPTPDKNNGSNQKTSKDQQPSNQTSSGNDGQPGKDKHTQQNNNTAKKLGQELPAKPASNMDAQPQTTDAAQAKQDAAASLNKSNTNKAAVREVSPSNTPISEKQLAQEQWLRRIPDDPGGLLRRKFMIEHMIRQQGSN